MTAELLQDASDYASRPSLRLADKGITVKLYQEAGDTENAPEDATRIGLSASA